jgi:hypothetical protein
VGEGKSGDMVLTWGRGKKSPFHWRSVMYLNSPGGQEERTQEVRVKKGGRKAKWEEGGGGRRRGGGGVKIYKTGQGEETGLAVPP